MSSSTAESLDGVYSSNFYSQHQVESLESARALLPLVEDIVSPRSVVDVGCGIGTWLSAWRERGVPKLLGIDGPWVKEAQLLIPTECFQQRDLSGSLNTSTKFDLAMCLEVAEHLDARLASGFVRSLCALSDVVLFSAAPPRQRGDHHVNEQWPDYWRDMFHEAGYVAFDPIRPRILHNEKVAAWYRQNTLLMVKAELALSDPRFSALPRYTSSMAIVSKAVLMKYAEPSLRDAVEQLPKAARSSALRQWERLRQRSRTLVWRHPKAQAREPGI